MRSTGIYILAALATGAAAGATQMHLSSASVPRHFACRGTARPMARLELLFGTSHPQGGTVNEKEWTSFLDTEVTPRFPAGLTVLNGPGQWRGSDGRLAKEQSRILVIWHEPTHRTEVDIEAIQSAYKVRFAQESVMRVDGTSCVSF